MTNLKRSITIYSFIFFTSIFIANAKEVNIDVNGLVCEFCVVTIEKSFKNRDEVKEVKIDFDLKKVFLIFKKGQDLPDKTIEEIITNNGYNAVKINR
jgi:copper chaperone CopZ